MVWDKEEANRAKEVAKQKMQKGEYGLARNFAEKAQRLFPELENISQLLTVCEVHCSAENKLFGELMDWYKILMIEQLAAEATIKKQYRKLALLLHPDKNKFSGAEAAFKLIGEANRVLADSASRSSYDIRYRAAMKVHSQKKSSHKFNGDKTSVSQQGGPVDNFQNVSRTKFSGSDHQLQSFWTCCVFCNMRYLYPKCVMSCLLHCQNCQRSFVACDIGAQGMSKGPLQNNGSVPNKGTKIASKNGRGTKINKKEAVDVKKEKEVEKETEVKKEKEEVGKCKSDAPLKPKESVTSRNTKRKRSRQSAGAERKGVPKGSFELDPPSVPSDVDEFCDPSDSTAKNGKVDTEGNGSCSKPPDNEVKQPDGSRWSSTPKKQKNDCKGETKKCRGSLRQQNITKYWAKVDKSQSASKVETDVPLGCGQEESHYEHTQSRRNVTSSKANITPKKKKKNGAEKETLKSGRSLKVLEQEEDSTK